MRPARSVPFRTSVLPLVGMALLLLLGLLAALPAAAQDESDPPGRVGRIAASEGPVWWFDQEQQRWADAQRNLPLTGGDRVSTDAGGRADLRIGSTALMVDEASELAFDRLDDEQLRVRVLRGSVALLLRSNEIASEVWIGTGDAWLRPLRSGAYRVQRAGAMTEATSWRGELQLDDGSRLIVDGGRRLQLWRDGDELRLQLLAAAEDAFAARVLAADREAGRAAAAPYVSTEMTGYEDLERYGRWEQDVEYGAVWVPTAVAVDWVPYRDGRWIWVRPWGWTWVDAAPWGFAPFHYGRWIQWRARWVWVPGPVVPRPVYAPALVAWIEAPAVGIGIRVGNVSLSWMPLPPWDVFRPAYRVSPRYLTRVDPPHWRRHRPPPGWKGGIERGRDDARHGVTVLPVDALRPPPPAMRRPEPPRPLLPGREPERPGIGRPPDREPGHVGRPPGFVPRPDRPRDRDRGSERVPRAIGGPPEAPGASRPEPPGAPRLTPQPEGRQRIPERAAPPERRALPEAEPGQRGEAPQRGGRRAER